MSENEKNLVVQMPQLPSGLKAIFAQVLCLDGKDRYFEPSCPVCSSKHRLDGEKLYKSYDKYAGTTRDENVQTFFEHKGEHYSIDAVRHHMTRHMDRGDQELRKSEYLSKLEALNANKMSTMEMIDYAMSSILERIIAQSAIAPDSKYNRADVEDMITSNIVSLNKAWVSLMQLRADMLGEMRKDGEAIVIPKASFEKVFEDAFKKSQTQEEHGIIAFILKGLGGLEHK
jgi:hypothetical protein